MFRFPMILLIIGKGSNRSIGIERQNNASGIDNMGRQGGAGACSPADFLPLIGFHCSLRTQKLANGAQQTLPLPSGSI